VSKFTPTTKMIRESIAYYLSQNGFVEVDEEEVKAQFDRWLDGVIAEATQATRELDRIETVLTCLHNHPRVPDKIGSPLIGETLVYRCGKCSKVMETPNLLIKGENK
jgi:hypothetical protein